MYRCVLIYMYTYMWTYRACTQYAGMDCHAHTSTYIVALHMCTTLEGRTRPEESLHCLQKTRADN